MYEIRLLIQQDMKQLFTNVLWIFYNTLFPLLLVLIMGQLTGSQYEHSTSAYAFYTISFLVYSACNAATIASNSFMEERIKQGNMRILYAPLTHDWLYRSKIIASTIFTFVCHLSVGVILVVIFDIPLGSHIGLLLLLLFLSEAFACCLGVLFCLLFQSESMANQVLSIFINLSAVFGGIFFSIERFSGVFTALSNFSVMKWILQAAVYCIYDGNIQNVILCSCCLSCLILLILIVCKVIFREEVCVCSL